MPTKASDHLVGILLLLVVNIVWVASAELTKYLFVDLNFKRPLFTTYVKSTMFTLFMVRYIYSLQNNVKDNSKGEVAKYTKLENSVSDEESAMEEFEVESLMSSVL
jgi:hypothetical protein